ncbi:sporulation integral membrane protein YlbJ [Bacillus taeanensis]|uniref:sporulation integral membrane protein YlbJ n=1 Tax=Bacillus taeanensis TaxID=273032 RepID=UPI0015F0D0E7|nr:sporulation integral membrane protein YlbJ [Bacillus taeanensis]
MNAAHRNTIFLALLVTFIAISIIIYPKEVFGASLRGLTMWWEIVFPSLLPFFIVSEMLIGLGVVSFIGILLEPFMRPIFRVPGVGGFVWAMGLASGFPAGAKFTARLRQEGQLSVIEAERLVSFTNSSNPLFMSGAIAVGFFGDAALGLLLMTAHYLGNICVGFIMRFHGKETQKAQPHDYHLPSIRKAFSALYQTRRREYRPIGKLLGDSVNHSIQTLLMIGGFIIIFSVLNKILSVVHIAQSLSYIISLLFIPFHIPTELSLPFLSGLFEITLGSRMASETESSSLLSQVIITSFILAFSGFSVQAQVASILADTDIRFQPFFIARIFHGCFAALFTLLFWKPLYIQKQAQEIPVFLNSNPSSLIGEIWLLAISIGPFITLFSLLFFIYYQTKSLIK